MKKYLQIIFLAALSAVNYSVLSGSEGMPDLSVPDGFIKSKVVLPPLKPAANVNDSAQVKNTGGSINKSAGDVDVLVQVFDQSGEPAAGVIHIVDNFGQYYSESGGSYGFVVEGQRKIYLQPGSYTVTLSGGPRALPEVTIVNLTAGIENLVKLTLRGYAPVSAAGWKMMDVYYDIDYAAEGGYKINGVTKLRDAAAATGVDIVSCAGLWNLKNEAGQKLAISKNGRAEISGIINDNKPGRSVITAAWSAQRPELGRFYALEINPVPSPQLEVGNQSFVNAFTNVRSRGGLNVYAYPGGLAAEREVAGELPFTTVAGPLYDLIDISRGGKDIRIWWTLLDMGYHIPAVGGGFSTSNLAEVYDLPKSGIYLQIPRKHISAPMVIEALRCGRAIISNGPFLRFYVRSFKPGQESDSNDGKIGNMTVIGGTLYPSTTRRKVILDAYACSDAGDSIKRIELIYNGKVIAKSEGKENQKTLKSEWGGLLFDKTGWLVARYVSTNERLWAMTNPIYISDVNAPPPAPVTANVRIRAIDPVSGKEFPATVIADNMGVTIGRWKSTDGVIKVPATAELIVSGAGNTPVKLNLYRESGAWRYIQELRNSRSLSRNLYSQTVYDKVRQMLSSISITVKLKH